MTTLVTSQQNAPTEQNGRNREASLMTSSHRRHRQDKTVLSCRRPRCELNWRHVKTVGNWKFLNSYYSFVQFCAVWTESCRVLTQFPIRSNVVTYCDVIIWKLDQESRCTNAFTLQTSGQNCSVSSFDLKTTENCLRLSLTQFSPSTLTVRRDETV